MILLNKQHLHVFKNFNEILRGYRNKIDGLWDVPIPYPMKTAPHKPFNNKLNIITPVKQHTQTLVNYVHAALFSPAKSTVIKALQNNHFIGWPGFTLENVRQFLTETPATAKGHLDQHKQNLQSTQSQTINGNECNYYG